MSVAVPLTLHDLIPPEARPSNDVLLGRFLDYVADLRASTSSGRISDLGVSAASDRVDDLGSAASATWIGRHRLRSRTQPAHPAEVVVRPFFRAMRRILHGHLDSVHVGRESTRRFDLCFLDAEKEHYEPLFQLARRTLEPGALVVADNVLSHEELNAYSQTRQADGTLESVTVPLDRGLELSVVLSQPV